MDAFEELYRQHTRRVYSLVARMIGSQSEAEDLLQDVFFLAFRKLDSFKGDSAFSTWLYRLAVNHCLDYLRSKGARMAQATDALEYDTEWSVADAYTPPAVRPTTLDLERAIAALPDGCRAVFVLHDVEGFGHREIASILGIAEGTSKSQVHKARMRVRAFLTRGAPVSQP
jgi:RNA polymerase sigma-70 factor (ECF subfamily)